MFKSHDAADQFLIAVKFNKPAEISRLVALGVDVDARLDSADRTALHYAVINNKLPCIKSLITAGADVNAHDEDGLTCLHRAVCDGHPLIVMALIQAGCLLDNQDENGNTALHEASWNGYINCVRILIDAKANVNIYNKSGFTALHLAAQNGHSSTVQTLLDSNAYSLAKNNYGDTPLHLSSRYGHHDVCRLLVTAGANKSLQNLQNNVGDTPLHIAARIGHEVVAAIIVDSGNLIAVKNNVGETARDVAIRCGHRNISSMIPSNSLPRNAKKQRPKSANISRCLYDSVTSLNASSTSALFIPIPVPGNPVPKKPWERKNYLKYIKWRSKKEEEDRTKKRRSCPTDMTIPLTVKYDEMCFIEKQYSMMIEGEDSRSPLVVNGRARTMNIPIPTETDSLSSTISSTSAASHVDLNNNSTIKRSQSKDDLHQKPQEKNDKHKRKFLGLFRSASDQDLQTNSKTQRSFLRRKKTGHKDDKELQQVATNGAVKDHPDILADNVLSYSSQDQNIEKSLTDSQSNNPVNPHLSNVVGKDDLANNNNENDLLSPALQQLGEQESDSQDEEVPVQHLETPPTVLPHQSRVEPLELLPLQAAVEPVDSLPPDGMAWKRAKELWEKSEAEETQVNKEERRKKRDKKGHSDKTREERKKEEKDKKHHSKSRSRDHKERGERSDSKSRSKERRSKESHHDGKHERSKHDEKQRKDHKHKHKSKTDKQKHGGETTDDSQPWFGKEREEREHNQHRNPDKKQRHKHSHRHSNQHEEKPEKHPRKHHEKHTHNEHKQVKGHEKKHSDEHKKIELDKVWREYESGKRYYSMEKDMKKVIDRLDGVDRYRREERQRSTDRSRGFSSDTSCEVTHRSRSRERRRRSRSREKNKHESDQDVNSWHYSLGRIEARQEQCKADIDTARRSIEHRIKQLEARLEKQYSSSEKLPERNCEKLDASEARDIKTMIDKVADECREVTRTLDVRTEEMKTEIATVVREEFSNLDERLSYGYKSPESPISFYGMQTGEFTSKPNKLIDDVTTSLASFQRLSSADESMITVIEENSRVSRQSPVRVSQSGALDTQSEPALPLAGGTFSDNTEEGQGVSQEPPDSPLTARSKAFENLYELSIQSLEDEEDFEEDEGPDCISSPEAVQDIYRRKIKETEERCQERALVEKEMLYKRINELETMLLAARSSTENHT